MLLCQAITAKKIQCTAKAKNGSNFCGRHKEKSIKNDTDDKEKLINENVKPNLIIKKDNGILYTNENFKTDKENKDYVLQIIKKAHDILYSHENLESNNAMNDIMNFIFIKLLEKKISDNGHNNTIDLLNKTYYTGLYDDEQLEDIFTNFLNLKNLENRPSGDIRNINPKFSDCIKEMGDILTLHPLTSQIFKENNFIKAEKSTTIFHLLRDVINCIDINKFSSGEDVIGDIYEYFINNYNKKGTQLGQFFTPRSLMNCILNYKKNDIISLIEEDIKIMDPCMGTGGWLVSAYNLLNNEQKNKVKLIGGEVEPKTFQYGLMNCIMTLNKFPYYMQRENSLTHVNEEKVDCIVTNPPFKADFKYDNLKINYENDSFSNKMDINEIYKCKSDNSTVQFIELCIYKLKENGLCIIVLPYGELFFGTSNKKIRKYLLDNIEITDIIICPKGIFAHTGVDTCIIVFKKNKNGTNEIQYSRIIDNCEKIINLGIISKEILMTNENISFQHNKYFSDNDIEQKNENLLVYKLSDISYSENGKILSRDNMIEGIYPVIGGGKKPTGFHHVYNTEENTILVSASGSAGYISKYNTKTWASDCFKIIPNQKYILNNYLYYILKYQYQDIIYEKQKGTCQKHIHWNDIKDLNIRIPNLEKQNEIVEYLDFLEICNKTNNEKIEQLKKLNKYYLNSQIINEKNIVPLETICLFIGAGKRNSKEGRKNGLYPLFYCSILEYLYIDEYDYDDEAIIINKTNGSGKCNIYYINGKFSTAQSTEQFKSKDLNILTKYIYYYLKNNINLLEENFKGSLQKSISKEDLKQILIKIPNIEKQTEIINYCQNNDNIINLLENETKNNNELNKIYLYNYINN